MRETRISLPELGMVAMTRGALGVGIGLLLSGWLGGSARRAVGWALVVTGALTTIPIALEVLHKTRVSQARGAVDADPAPPGRPQSGPSMAHT